MHHTQLHRLTNVVLAVLHGDVVVRYDVVGSKPQHREPREPIRACLRTVVGAAVRQRAGQDRARATGSAGSGCGRCGSSVHGLIRRRLVLATQRRDHDAVFTVRWP